MIMTAVWRTMIMIIMAYKKALESEKHCMLQRTTPRHKAKQNYLYTHLPRHLALYRQLALCMARQHAMLVSLRTVYNNIKSYFEQSCSTFSAFREQYTYISWSWTKECFESIRLINIISFPLSYSPLKDAAAAVCFGHIIAKWPNNIERKVNMAQWNFVSNTTLR